MFDWVINTLCSEKFIDLPSIDQVNTSCRGVFRTRSNVYDEAFFAKIVNGLKALTISQKSFIVNVRLSSKHASVLSLNLVELIQSF